jgi:hypothetical protein
MAVSRSSLGRGPAIVTLGGQTLFMRDSLLPKHSPVWKPVGCTHLGQIDKYKSDFVIKNTLQLFGAWQSLAVLFPSALLNPVVGTSLFGASDTPMVILAKNNDQITYPNTRVTKLIDLSLSLDNELFAATLETTSLLSNNTAPETAGAYFTRATGSYAETTFALTNFLKTRWTAVWTGKTGFTSFIGQKGFNVAWTLDLKTDVVDGYGTVDMYVGEGGLVAAMKCVPIGPTAAQADTAQNPHAVHGALLSAGAADLTMTGLAAGSVVLKGAAMVEFSTAFGIEPLRVNETAWETTRAITTGAVGAVATIS